jgi:hypothetical protein
LLRLNVYGQQDDVQMAKNSVGNIADDDDDDDVDHVRDDSLSEFGPPVRISNRREPVDDDVESVERVPDEYINTYADAIGHHHLPHQHVDYNQGNDIDIDDEVSDMELTWEQFVQQAEQAGLEVQDLAQLVSSSSSTAAAAAAAAAPSLAPSLDNSAPSADDDHTSVHGLPLDAEDASEMDPAVLQAVQDAIQYRLMEQRKLAEIASGKGIKHIR